MLSEVSPRKTDTVRPHLQVESKTSKDETQTDSYVQNWGLAEGRSRSGTEGQHKEIRSMVLVVLYWADGSYPHPGEKKKRGGQRKEGQERPGKAALYLSL